MMFSQSPRALSFWFWVNVASCVLNTLLGGINLVGSLLNAIAALALYWKMRQNP